MEQFRVASTLFSFSFVIDTSTGVITSKSKLDYETRSSYAVIVMASDNGTPVKLNSTVAVNISVLDSNDNRPTFHKRVYYFNVTENAPVSVIGVLEVNF